MTLDKSIFSKRAISVIKTGCPYCKRILDIVDDRTVFHLNRLGGSLHKCEHCGKSFRIFYSGETLMTTRIGPR